MIVELKKGYTIESRYDKFTDSYITRLIDPDGKQVKDARYSDDMVDRNYDIQDIKDYFNNYINIGLSEREVPDIYNAPYEPEEDDEFPELEDEETFEDEEDMFEESLDQEVKKKARKTKIATRKSKLPALSKLSPIMPDQAKGIAKFNAMQPDGNSGMMSTTGSTSLGEEYMSRDLLIDKIRNMGYKYNFDKYTDAQLYRIYQERVETAKKRAAKRAERQRRAAEEDNKRENAKDSYFKDGIEFESEEAAKEYFGEAMETKIYLNDMHKAWDIVEDFKENELKESLNESLTKSKNIHNFKTLNEGLSYFNTKAFEDNYQDLGLDLMLESVRDKLTKDDIKKLGALMNKTDDPDDVVTYVKGLLSEDLDEDNGWQEPWRSESGDEKFWDLMRDGERIGTVLLHDSDGDGVYSAYVGGPRFNNMKNVGNTRGSLEDAKAMVEEVVNQLKEDFDLDQFKDNLEREKDYYGSKAQGLKMIAYPLNNKIMRAAEKAGLWVDEEGCVIDDIEDEIQLSFYVDGDWKHDHARFDMLVREIVYDMGMDLNGYYQEDESDSDSDNYRSLHVFEIDASKPNEINESLNENVKNEHVTTAEDIDEIQRILEVLNSEGFILDDAVAQPLQMNPFGGKRKTVHFQVINPNLYYPTSETEGEEITEDESYRLFVDDIKPLVAALDDLEAEDDFEGYVTFNFGANKDGKITAGLDWRE